MERLLANSFWACNTHPAASQNRRFTALPIDTLIDTVIRCGLCSRIPIRPDLHPEEVKGNEANIKKLNAGRIGCYANDRMSVIHSAKGLRGDPEFKNFKLHEAVELSGEDAFIAYSGANNASYKADFIAKMNTAIEDAKKAGVLTKLIADYSK